MLLVSTCCDLLFVLNGIIGATSICFKRKGVSPLSEFSSSLSVCCFKFAEVPNMQSTLNDMQQKKFDPPSNINENNLLTRGRFLLERKLEDKLLKALNNTQHIKNQL